MTFENFIRRRLEHRRQLDRRCFHACCRFLVLSVFQCDTGATLVGNLKGCAVRQLLKIQLTHHVHKGTQNKNKQRSSKHTLTSHQTLTLISRHFHHNFLKNFNYFPLKIKPGPQQARLQTTATLPISPSTPLLTTLCLLPKAQTAAFQRSLRICWLLCFWVFSIITRPLVRPRAVVAVAS